MRLQLGHQAVGTMTYTDQAFARYRDAVTFLENLGSLDQLRIMFEVDASMGAMARLEREAFNEADCADLVVEAINWLTEYTAALRTAEQRLQRLSRRF
jgi:hypothetical protein